MAWKSLKDQETGLEKRPHVLAGPILRKVTSSSVTVWVALRKPGKVTLKVLDTDLVGSDHTVALGANLHIVAVTTEQPAPSLLVEGKIYRYDLSFDYDDNQSETLGSATRNAKLAYDGFDKPSFCLPPGDINKLRIIHGSCRIPHGNGDDTLPMLDDLIERNADKPYARPHQLLLTGDQIYADDVGYAMSMMLMDASEALLGWSEEIVCNVPAKNAQRAVKGMYPRLRGRITQIDAGFTSVDFHGQLIGLGEYLAMYLFVWSDVLWPASFDLPSADEIKSFFSQRETAADKEWFGRQELEDFKKRNFAALVPTAFDPDDVDSETKRTAQFGRTIKDNVRRALANIPSYMIFDDHEVTDDWNMTRKFCDDVYGSPLGLRIVQNGLTAYALCQHWGNAPEQFQGATPGAKLLKALQNAHGVAAYDNASNGVRALLGIQGAAALKQRTNYGLFHGADSLTYNYTIEGDGHQVIVTDTRTWRDYPRAKPSDPDSLLEGGDMLPLSQLKAQIADVKPDTGNRMLMIVLTTNAPPAQPIRTAARYPGMTKPLAAAFSDDPFPDLYESWEMSRNATDLLFRIISDRLPLVNDPKYGRARKGSAILLSGDVHTSFTSRLAFRGKKRYLDPKTTPQPVNVVFVQMVCSSLRKQTDKTEGQHLDGYTYAPTGAGLLVPAHKPEGYLGWNLGDNEVKHVGGKRFIAGSVQVDEPIVITGPRSYSIWNMPHGFKEILAHDWSYRLDYLIADVDATLPGAPPPLPPGTFGGNTAADRKRDAEIANRTVQNYLRFLKANASPRQVVGVNNIGEITFKPGNAVHTLRWHDWATGTDRYTKYVCSLDPDDGNFAEIATLP